MADDFSEKLNAVLSNPDAMGQIMSIARSLGGEGAEPAPQPQAAEPPPAAELSPALPAAQEPAMPDLSGLLGLLGGLTGGGSSPQPSAAPANLLSGLDPRLIQTGLRLFSEYNREDDRAAALLTALKPFLKEERAAKIDRAARAAKLARLARVALEMFKEGSNV